MKKVNDYLGILMLFIVLALFCSFYKLIYPELMLDTYGVIFDQYNTSGVIWSFWKMISYVTRVLTLVTISVSLFAIVCELQQFVKARFFFCVSLALNFINAICLFGLMAAEKSESILKFLIKIFAAINRTEFSSASDLSVFQNKLDYVSSRNIVLYIILLILLLCAIWIKKKPKIEKVDIATTQIAIYILEVGFLHSFFNYCTESRLLFKIFGIERDQWELINDSIIGKNGFGFFFYIPVMFIIAISLTLLLFNKWSIIKLLLLNGVLLLAHIIYVITAVFYQLSKHEINASNQKLLFFSLTAKKVILSECIGLFIFEFVTIFVLIQFLQKKCSVLQLIQFPICIFIISMLVVMIFHKVELVGIIIGLVSLFFSAFFILNLCYRKKIVKI